jgi:hypothetical protein
MNIDNGSVPGINTTHGNGFAANHPTAPSAKTVITSTSIAGISHEALHS